MKKELDYYLVKKYPEIFADRYGKPTQTAMCWGFDCGDGWFKLINLLCWQIQHHIDSAKEAHEKALGWQKARDENRLEDIPQWIRNQLSPDYEIEIPPLVSQVRATQVKEKFGSLRFYVAGGDDVTHALISMAESLSGQTCEICGEAGKMQTGGWIRTLCKKHAEENHYDPKEYDREPGDAVGVLLKGEFFRGNVEQVHPDGTISVREDDWRKKDEERRLIKAREVIVYKDDKQPHNQDPENIFYRYWDAIEDK
jgi:hypothetical protein